MPFYESYAIISQQKKLRRLKFLQEDVQNEIEVSKLNCYSRITYKIAYIKKTQKFLGIIKMFFE